MSDTQLNKFIESVTDRFFFLEKLGFKRYPLEKIDFECPQDRRVEIRYLSESLCVLIRWYMIYANFEVGLIESDKGRLPEKYSFYGDEGYARGISLCDLVELITEGKEKSPFEANLAGHSKKKKALDWEERGKLINDKMDWLISVYAEMLERYGGEILKGDISVFPEVQEYSKSKL